MLLTHEIEKAGEQAQLAEARTYSKRVRYMWREDNEGTEFNGPAEVYRSLRDRAQRTIEAGDQQGFDLRNHRVRVRDEEGKALFEGTLDDAARLEINGRTFLPRRTAG